MLTGWVGRVAGFALFACVAGCSDSPRGMGTMTDAAPSEAAGAPVNDGSPAVDIHSVPRGVCGDGWKYADEPCDDGNNVSGDGCSADCQVECPPSNPRCWMGATAGLVCGDSVRGAGEACDDGNTVDGDGCSAACTTEPGWTCPLEGQRCFPVCGDAMVTPPETCDDGNTIDGDGCSSICEIEGPCFAVDGTPAPCPPACGNGFIDGSEACDDGAQNADLSGACSTTCQRRYVCGDGVVTPPETCDPGPDSAPTIYRYAGDTAPGCTATCTTPGFCGDGRTDTDYGEQCDLGAYNGQPVLVGSEEVARVVCDVDCKLIGISPAADAGSGG